MSFIEEVKQRAKKELKTIVLPEAEDIRILEATSQVLKENYANIVLVGKQENIERKAKENNLNIKGAKIVDPSNSEKKDEYINLLYELRKNKGMTREKATELVEDSVYFGMLMVKDDKTEADGLVSGAAHSTSDTLRPALQILKTAPRYQIGFCFFCYGSARL